MTTSMDLEAIMVKEIIQKEKDIYHMISLYIWNQTMKEGNTNNVTKADTKKRANWYSHSGGLLGGVLYKYVKWMKR